MLCTSNIAQRRCYNLLCVRLQKQSYEIDIFLKGELTVISRAENSRKRAEMLQDMHYRNISQRLVLLRRTEEAAKYLEQTKLQTSNGFTEEFTVMEDLMGLAIGAHGANIQQA